MQEDPPSCGSPIGPAMMVVPQEEGPSKEPPPRVVAVMVSRIPPGVPPELGLHASSQSRMRPRFRAPRICYQCEDYGHLARRCMQPENPGLVFQRLKVQWGSENKEGMEQGS